MHMDIFIYIRCKNCGQILTEITLNWKHQVRNKNKNSGGVFYLLLRNSFAKTLKMENIYKGMTHENYFKKRESFTLK